ncbi:MAG: hypothetical protein GF355_11295 [Candidatus Eisenbacteria bacterium]|nr:hypothetical protein [Candidatus Eisenbacteria bacterium]
MGDSPTQKIPAATWGLAVLALLAICAFHAGVVVHHVSHPHHGEEPDSDHRQCFVCSDQYLVQAEPAPQIELAQPVSDELRDAASSPADPITLPTQPGARDPPAAAVPL